MLPPDQIENIKQQIFSQIDSSNLQNKEEIKKSIRSMNAEQLEEFIMQNNSIKEDSSTPQNQLTSSSSGQEHTKCIFCSIVSGDIQYYKIDENKDAIAILEINPISKAHSMIIPKKHIDAEDKVPQPAFSLAKKISKKIKTKFKPKDVLISFSNLFGHEIINILPIYGNENMGSPRNHVSSKELQEIQKQLEKKQVIKKPRVKKIKNSKVKFPRRIP
ncbi:MAG: HIT domain-containing protein [archaeon]